MRIKPRLSELLKFSKPKTPGFGISGKFYLSVLAAKAPLPSMIEIVAPKPTNGAMPGFGVPLSRTATKECLQHPLERGAYAIAAPDQKTVIRMMLLSKEEAGFDPDACLLSSKISNLTPDMICRLRSTWTIMQLTFESHHPMVSPAIQFMTILAARLAFLTDGIIADPVAQVYRCPRSFPINTSSERIDVRDLCSVGRSHGFQSLQTFGLTKLALPELMLEGVSPQHEPIALDLLMTVAQRVVDGTPVHHGDLIGSERAEFVIRSQDGSMKLVPNDSMSVADALQSVAASSDR